MSHDDALEAATARLRDAQTPAEAKNAVRDIMRVRAANDDKVHALKAARDAAANPGLVQTAMKAERKSTIMLLTAQVASLLVVAGLLATVMSIFHLDR